jgi:hypothetical protein
MFKMSDAYKMSQETYRKVAGFRKDAKGWAQIQTVFQMTEGVSAKGFDAAFDAMTGEMAKVLVREEMEKDAKGIKVTVGLTKMAARAAEHGFVLTISYDAETEKATVSISGKRGRRASKDGDVASTSNISAWTAYQRGKKDGDKFDIRKVDGGYKHGDRFIPSKANGGLKNYILKMFPESKTAAVLAKYGKTLD